MVWTTEHWGEGTRLCPKEGRQDPAGVAGQWEEADLWPVSGSLSGGVDRETRGWNSLPERRAVSFSPCAAWNPCSVRRRGVLHEGHSLQPQSLGPRRS